MTRHGFEYIAYGPKAEGPRKLAILLHGYGRHALFMEKLALEIQNAAPFVTVLSPHAPHTAQKKSLEGPDNFFKALPADMAAHPSPSGIEREWFGIDGNAGLLIGRMQESAIWLNDFITFQQEVHDVGNEDIALAGFSQGGGMALYTALTRKPSLNCAVVHSSIVLEDSDHGIDIPSPAPVPLLFIHGDRDSEFSADRYDRAYDWIAEKTEIRPTRTIVKGLGHYTSAESRKHCAEFIGHHLSQ